MQFAGRTDEKSKIVLPSLRSLAHPCGNPGGLEFRPNGNLQSPGTLGGLR